jgi:conserved oligomeric Golgi complex subunit 3
VELAENISLRLNYFQELETATRILNRPGESIVLHPDFLMMTERVDICLEFLRNNVSLILVCG